MPVMAEGWSPGGVSVHGGPEEAAGAPPPWRRTRGEEFLLPSFFSFPVPVHLPLSSPRLPVCSGVLTPQWVYCEAD